MSWWRENCLVVFVRFGLLPFVSCGVAQPKPAAALKQSDRCGHEANRPCGVPTDRVKTRDKRSRTSSAVASVSECRRNAYTGSRLLALVGADDLFSVSETANPEAWIRFLFWIWGTPAKHHESPPPSQRRAGLRKSALSSTNRPDSLRAERDRQGRVTSHPGEPKITATNPVLSYPACRIATTFRLPRPLVTASTDIRN